MGDAKTTMREGVTQIVETSQPFLKHTERVLGQLKEPSHSSPQDLQGWTRTPVDRFKTMCKPYQILRPDSNVGGNVKQAKQSPLSG